MILRWRIRKRPSAVNKPSFDEILDERTALRGMMKSTQIVGKNVDDMDPGAGSSHCLSRTGHQVTLSEVICLRADGLPVGSSMCSLDGDTIPSKNESHSNTEFPKGMDMMKNSVSDPPGSIVVLPEVSLGRKRNISTITKGFLVENYFYKNNVGIDGCYKYLLEQFPGEMNHEQQLILKEAVKNLHKRFKNYWAKAYRSLITFQTQNKEWLNSNFVYPQKIFKTLKTKRIEAIAAPSKGGRPEKLFQEKSTISKRRDVARLCAENQNCTEKFLMATEFSARKHKQHDLAKIIGELLRNPISIMSIRGSLNHIIEKETPEEAVAYILDNNLSKQQYINMRLECKRKKADIWPRYDVVLAAKQKCYPSGLVVSDISAKVPLQNLLNHKVNKLIEMQVEVIEADLEEKSLQSTQATLISSWGFDGSTGHSAYNQAFNSSGVSVGSSDNSLLATTTIPLRLTANHGSIYWCNRTPQSVRFCSPIMLQYKKESTLEIRNTYDEIKKEIDELSPFTCTLSNGKTITVTYSMVCTLIDGKVMNVLTGCSGVVNCPICFAKPNQMNNIENFGGKVFEPKPGTLQFGISPLHMWIRFFECLLHISYRHDLKVWKVYGTEQKEILKKRKALVQDRFKNKFCMSVDQPRPGGAGTNTTGNVCRRAFEKPELLAEILDLDVSLVKNFRIILIAVNCQLPIDPEKFRSLCLTTAKIYNQHYSWFKMPPGVHKVLAHGAEIIINSVLPVGVLGEDAAESRNKLYKSDRLHHARKTNRVHTMTDVMNRAFETSDILISTISLKKRMEKRIRKTLPAEVLELIICSNNSKNNIDTDEEIDEEDIDLDSPELHTIYNNLDNVNEHIDLED